MTVQKQWILRHKPNWPVVENLAKAINVNVVLASLLVAKNITSFEAAKRFFRAGIESLHDPFLMKDMRRAVERIAVQMNRKQKILFYGDYDVDGTTAVALMALFFDTFYPHYEVYVPSRDDEGYGLSKQGIDFAKQTGCSLIIALDCGTRDYEAIDYANAQHIDVIVCDHHTIGDTLPKAYALLNPKRPDCTYPYKELSGCGIGFKLTQALSEYFHLDQTTWMNGLDLVAVSTAADMVPLTGENRIIEKAGIDKLIKNPHPGLKALKAVGGLDDNRFLNVNDIVFKLAPRINAAGRMEHALQAVELLKAKTLSDAEPIALHLHTLNRQRQDIEKAMLETAVNHIEENLQTREIKALTVYLPQQPKGVLGIVASKLAEYYHKPTIVLTDNKSGILTGSARSIEDFDLYSAISGCKHYLEKFGGHQFAAGLSLKIEQLKNFETCFEQIVSETMTPEQEILKIWYDAELSFSRITPKFVAILNQFCPFGPNNRRPVFMTRRVRPINGSRMVGKNNDVMRLILEDEHQIRFQAVGFGFKDLESLVFSAPLLDICYVIEENTFRGTTTLQLRLKDIRESR